MGPGLENNVGKPSQNSPVRVLVFWGNMPCVFSVYIYIYTFGLSVSAHVTVSDGFKNKIWIGAWVGGVSSIQFFLIP